MHALSSTSLGQIPPLDAKQRLAIQSFRYDSGTFCVWWHLVMCFQHLVGLKIGGPQYRPPNTIVLAIGDP